MRLRGRIKDLLAELDERALDAAAEVIAEDIRRVDPKRFARALLECCSIECIAKAIVAAGGLEDEPLEDTSKP